MKIDLKLGNLRRLLSIQNSFQGFRAVLRFSSTVIELMMGWDAPLHNVLFESQK
jgi:hypothetical protein